MVVTIDCIVSGKHRQDGRHGEHVRYAVPLDEPPRLLAVQPFARQQHRCCAARHLRQGVHAGAVRQRRDHQGHVVLRGAGHQVAQVVADDVLHLAVRQHARLGAAGRAGGVEEPRRMVVRDICRALSSASSPPARPTRHQSKSPAGRPDFPPSPRRRVLGVDRIEDVHRGAGGFRQIRDLRRGQAKIRRHPYRTEHPRGEHRLEHGVGIARVQQDAVAMPHAACRQRRRRTPGRGRNCAQVQVRSRQMIAGRSGNRRAVCNSRCARLLVGISAASPGSKRSWPPRRRPC